MTIPLVRPQPLLPPSTIVPMDEDLFISYFNRIYEDIAFAVNNKQNTFYEISVTDTAANIPNLPTYGAFLVCVSGKDSTLPTLTASLCKSDLTAAGSITVIGSQVGTGTWAGNSITITSTATHFQISHNKAATAGKFNLVIMGTQGY